MNWKNGKVFTIKFVGTGPSSYEKIIYRAAVSQRLRNTAINWGACVYVGLSTQSRALLKVLTVCQHVKIFPDSMKPECLLPSHQYFPNPAWDNPRLIYFKIRWILCFHFYLDLPGCRLSWKFPAKPLCLCYILDYHSGDDKFTIFYDVM